MSDAFFEKPILNSPCAGLCGGIRRAGARVILAESVGA
jgi:hypothetical protein